MRLTKVLYAQHIGWHFKMKWRTQKRLNIQNENVVANLKEIGLPVIDPYQEFVAEREIPNPPSVYHCYYFGNDDNLNLLFIYISVF